MQVRRAPVARAKPRVLQPLPIVEVMTPEGAIDKVSNEGIERIEQMQRLEQDLFKECLEGCQDQLTAFDLDPDDLEAIPDHWRKELPDEIAVKRRHAIAKAALLPSRAAPAALETMRAMVNQTIRSRERGPSGMVHQLNVAVVVGGEKHDYNELEIGPEEE